MQEKGLTFPVSGDKHQMIRRLVKTNQYRLSGAIPAQDRKKGNNLLPITMGKIGESYTIRKITGRDDVRQHLAELGFVLDTRVVIVSQLSGNLILQVRDSRVALDKTMANHILVS